MCVVSLIWAVVAIRQIVVLPYDSSSGLNWTKECNFFFQENIFYASKFKQNEKDDDGGNGNDGNKGNDNGDSDDDDNDGDGNDDNNDRSMYFAIDGVHHCVQLRA